MIKVIIAFIVGSALACGALVGNGVTAPIQLSGRWSGPGEVYVFCDNFNRVYVTGHGGIAVTRLDPQCR